MSLSFTTNSSYLANWGFSVGDIAALSGAGRAIITWMTAAHRDTALLDFLNTVPTELGLRKGLIDPESLNLRWGREISLLHNGRRTDYTTAGQTGRGSKSRIDNLDRFTWLMTLLVVCLDQVVSNTSLKAIITELSVEMFADKVLELEYLRHEITQHIEGWRSIGTVRKMSTRASIYWKELLRNGHHLPGFAPDEDCDEIVRFLVWLAVGDTKEYVTASSDTFSLAMMLQEMGIPLLRATTTSHPTDESYIVARLDFSIVPSGKKQWFKNRAGMRIPLLALEESIALWPGPVESNNYRRDVFSLGRRAAQGIEFASRAVIFEDMHRESHHWMLAFCRGPRQLERASTLACSLVRQYLLLTTRASIEAVTELGNIWWKKSNVSSEFLLNDILLSKDYIRDDVLNRARDDPPISSATGFHMWQMIGDFQIFLLGYYYTALESIIDASQLTIKEGFGDWRWYDQTLIREIRSFVSRGREYNATFHGCSTEYERTDMLQLVAMLYAGATEAQRIAIGRKTVGLSAKLTIVTPGLLGDADDPEKVRKFVLLDIDSTCIPSNSAKIFNVADLEGKEGMVLPRLRIATPQFATEIAVGKSSDFTAHIEPAWDYDLTLCRVAFRHEGRMVHRVSPLLCEAIVLKSWTTCSRYLYGADKSSFLYGHKCSDCCAAIPASKVLPCINGGSPVAQVQLETNTLPDLHGLFASMGASWGNTQCYRADATEFHGSRYVHCINVAMSDPEAQRPVDDIFMFTIPKTADTSHRSAIVFVPSQGKAKMRTCIVTMYTHCCPGPDDEFPVKIRDFNWYGFGGSSILLLNQESGLIVLL